jgi:hypothetical protein
VHKQSYFKNMVLKLHNHGSQKSNYLLLILTCSHDFSKILFNYLLVLTLFKAHLGQTNHTQMYDVG